MKEVIDRIAEEACFSNSKAFTIFLETCIEQYCNSEEEDRESVREHKSVIFRIAPFFKGFSSFINEFGKDKKYEAGVEAVFHIAKELGIDVDKKECFIFFHLRNLGKFRKKESALFNELKNLWTQQYKEYSLDDQSFSAALRNLRNEKMIIYRKGNLQLPPTLIIRYK